MPIYNAEKFIDQSVNNLIQISSYFDQVLIIDDGSTDLDHGRCEQIQLKDPRIEFLRYEHSGLVGTLNKGISLAKNEIIVRADVDDLYDSSRVDAQVAYLVANPQISAVFCDYQMTGDKNENLGLFPSAIFPELTAFSLVSSQRTPHPGVAFRKSAIIRSGGYQENDFPIEDLALWLRLIQKHQIASIPSTLLYYRYHAQSITRTRELEMKAKSHLARQTFASSEYCLALINSLSNRLAEYENHSLSESRILFFLEDLLTYNRLTKGGNRKIVFKIFFSQLIKNHITLIPPFLIITIMKFKRLLRKIK